MRVDQYDALYALLDAASFSVVFDTKTHLPRHEFHDETMSELTRLDRLIGCCINIELKKPNLADRFRVAFEIVQTEMDKYNSGIWNCYLILLCNEMMDESPGAVGGPTSQSIVVDIKNCDRAIRDAFEIRFPSQFAALSAHSK